MGSLMNKQKSLEKSKRYSFFSVAGAGLLTWYFLTPFFGIPIFAAGCYMGYKWFQFRAKNGMRF